MSPGPAFNINLPVKKLKLKSPTYRIGTGVRRSMMQEKLNIAAVTPGPGQYEMYTSSIGSFSSRKKKNSFSR